MSLNSGAALVGMTEYAVMKDKHLDKLEYVVESASARMFLMRHGSIQPGVEALDFVNTLGLSGRYFILLN